MHSNTSLNNKFPALSVVLVLFLSTTICAGAAFSAGRAVQDKSPTDGSQTKPAGPWSPDEIIQPADLARSLSENLPAEQRPLILQVGIVHLFKMSHIPGSKYAGQANTPEGIATLKKEVEGVSHDKKIILYCGCCPWEHCPNIKPAYAALHDLGFKQIRLLNLPASFGQDWVKAGYPEEKSGA